LWDNATSATTAYQVAAFLSYNNFNGVRLPLMVNHILKNTPPNKRMINRFTNRAIDVKDYMSLLKSITKALQFRRIGIMLSMHTLMEGDNGKLWYNKDISEETFLKSIDKLTSALCSDEYWNILGIDLKNEPYGAVWGGKDPALDFRSGAKRIAERMLKGCRKWLAFVEGLNYRSSTVNIDGEKIMYNDWFGGGLQDAGEKPIELNTSEKIVWAPHYYNPGVFPQPYLYGGGEQDPTTKALMDYIELSDKKLKLRVEGTMKDMFGYLLQDKKKYAVVLGEFGGLYASDKHPNKTTQRTVDYTVQVMVEENYAGGFMWSLNPESKYQYIAADTGSMKAVYPEGLLQDDWLNVNEKFLNALKPMDQLRDLKKFPCFPKEIMR
jgi:aryl-phospho-beta-D-glucosidase BglC (GH1 family)